MTIGSYDFPAHRSGDTLKAITFTITINTLPLDLTDALIKMDVRTPGGTLTQRFTTEIDEGLTILLPPTDGQFKFDEQVINFLPGEYVYDMEFTLQDGTIETYVEGGWEIIKDITHD